MVYKKQDNIDSDKLFALIASYEMNRKYICESVGITPVRMKHVLHSGGKLTHDQTVIADKMLKKKGIEIKERIINFD